MLTTTYPIVPKKVQLNALNSTHLAQYYQEQLGFTLIKEKDKIFSLGNRDADILLEIFPHAQKKVNKTSGLYHTAFLFPKESDLAHFYKYLKTHHTPLQGASHHGYSKALYLQDPEGNGLEFYYDLPISQWDINKEGQIKGVTNRLDLSELSQLVSSTAPDYQLPRQTKVGHFHLQVGQLDKVVHFYQTILHLATKQKINHHAQFLASGLYHHHLALNTWLGLELDHPHTNTQGIRSCVWQCHPTEITAIIQRLNELHYPYTNKKIGIELIDPAGIRLKINRMD
ncbi:VOC family protein [Facklamia hominis]|uniref:VOC family protein n=1 Tax=Facklamia hominis TaxID=178214 RepID=A0AAJ1V5Y7_9LACT|nr:VOC family protein [Facklamia hominis]MDK7187684.1 VOC family protein [Facklamia hominis]RYC98693.1 hypothetical protein EKN08_01965 [Facklamia hominis]